MSFNKNTKALQIALFIILVLGVVFYFFIFNKEIKYTNTDSTVSLLGEENQNINIAENEIEEKILIEENKNEDKIETEYIVTHIDTPDEVKALYISSWVAGSPKYRDPILKIIDETEINSIVIDIKDSTGRISFKIDDDFIINIGSVENRISDIRKLTSMLHERGIYIIGRISVFQDSYMANKKPEWSIKRLSDGGVWKDKKGLSFLDPANKDVMDYTISIAKASYDLGFDEINFDYIRYPSDGNMKDINYRLRKERHDQTT